MNEQKICIIGDGLAGLSTATALSEAKIKIDLYTSNNQKNKILNDNRITAISESSSQFIKKKMNIKNNFLVWSCKEISLYFENKKNIKNFLNFKEDKKNLMHIFQNKKFKKILKKKILDKKNIRLIKKKITNINFKEGLVLIDKKIFYYDLIILCTGVHSKFYDQITHGRFIEKNYNEVALSTIVEHESKITKASQFFLKEGPLAILPFNKNSFSVVWSVNNSFFNKNKKFLKNSLVLKIKLLLNNIKIKKVENIQSFPIKLNLKTKYFKNNILILGDGLHMVHPLAGQGFNLVLRDIKKLGELILKSSNLGLPLKNSFLLEHFSQSRKPENIILGLGIDLTHTFFKDRKYILPFKKIILNNISNFKFVKKISKIISNKGISI